MMVAEFVDALQTPESVDLELDVVVAAFRADGAGGGLDVLGLDRGDDLLRGDVQTGHTQRIEPDAHTVCALSHDARLADAVDAGQRIADVQPDVVGKFQLRQRSAVRHEGVHRQNVAGTFPYGHAERLHLLRQRRFGALDGVLHVDLRHVVVGAGFKGDGQRVVAGIVRCRGEVDHILDAVHLRFDDRTDRFGDHLGAGARDSWRKR